MTKADLIQGLCDKTNFTKKDIGAMLDALVGFITADLQVGNEVVLHGIGKFFVKRMKARAGVNPATGEHITIPASKKVAFRVHKVLKDAVKG